MRPRRYPVIEVRCGPLSCVEGVIVSGAGILLLLSEQYLIVFNSNS